MSGNEIGCITVQVMVTVDVDPNDDELLDKFDESSSSFSIAEVVRAEIESNLESISYVRQVSVERIERR
jgi:hypothetical protein